MANLHNEIGILSGPDAYPAVFHCSAGKDRTGVVAALILGMAGVTEEALVYDYALSRTAMPRLAAHLLSTYPDASERPQQLAPAMMATAPETMTLFPRALHRSYGSFDGYASAIARTTAVGHMRALLLT